jgi:23S rRNA maturation mini-RNase III
MGGIGTTPQQQLAWKLMMAAFQQHTINSAMESLTPEQKQAMARAMNPAPKQEPKSDDKYADL